MYIVTLRFSANKEQAADHAAAHQAWIASGLNDGVFPIVGTIRPNNGGAIVADGVTAQELRQRINADPFVAHDVVTAEIIDVETRFADPRLAGVIS